MDNYRVPIDSRKEIVMTINTPTTSTTTISYDYKLLSILINHMVNELDPTRVWSVVERSMTDISKVDPELNTQVVNIVRDIYRDKTAPTNSTTAPTTSTTDSNKESTLKGGDATRKEATTMANNINTTVPTTTSTTPTTTTADSTTLNMTLPNDYTDRCNHLDHGRLSASINEAGTEYTCTICGANFAPQMPTDADINASVRVLSDVINLAKMVLSKKSIEPFSLMIPMMGKVLTLKSIVEPKLNNTTSTTDSNKESTLKGDNVTRNEATIMTTNNKNTEAGELIANFIKDSLGSTLPNEYKIITRIVEAIPIISKAVKSALSIALIRAILTGNGSQSLKLEDGDTVSNVKALIRALTNKDKVTISDLVKILKYGSYDCLIDEEGRIAATLIYINLYK